MAAGDAMGLPRRGAYFVAPWVAVTVALSLPVRGEGRRSALGWTDAHNVAYGLPVLPGGELIPREAAAEFLAGSSDDYLCARNDYGQTALHLAVRQNHADVVDLYVARRLCLDVANGDGDTALHYAAVFQRTDAVWMLLGAGADPTAKNDLGDTPLDDAKANRAKKVIEILQAASANPPRSRSKSAAKAEL